MKILKRCSIQLVALLGLLLLAACAASSPTMATEAVLAPTSTSTSVPPTSTPRLTETSLPTQTPIPTRVPTRTPVPTIVKTTQTLTATDPMTQEIESFLTHLHVMPDSTRRGVYRVQVRQTIDVNRDGLLEYFVSGDYTMRGYYAILGRTAQGWGEWYYTEFTGKYGGGTHTQMNDHVLIVDAWGRDGGTGAVRSDWRQDWIQCEVRECRLVWQQQIVETSSWGPLWVPPDSIAREYRIAQVEQPDANTIHVVTRYLSNQVPTVPEKPISLTVHTTMQRIVGPDIERLYRWDGEVFRLEHQEQIDPGMDIDRVFDQSTAETIRLVNLLLGEPFRNVTDGSYLQQLEAAEVNFWGPQAAKQAVDGRWARTFAEAAAHTGTAEELGEWIGSVSSSEKGRPYCRLSMHQHNDNGFKLVGNIDLPCALNFTRVAWADVTDDGQPELLLTTFPPDDDTGETGAGIQRLYVYAVQNGLQQIARIDGTINGVDSIGIRWRETANGQVEILAGLPLVPMSFVNVLDYWPDLHRHFQVYRWDKATQTLVVHGTEVEP